MQCARLRPFQTLYCRVCLRGNLDWNLAKGCCCSGEKISLIGIDYLLWKGNAIKRTAKIPRFDGAPLNFFPSFCLESFAVTDKIEKVGGGSTLCLSYFHKGSVMSTLEAWKSPKRGTKPHLCPPAWQAESSCKYQALKLLGVSVLCSKLDGSRGFLVWLWRSWFFWEMELVWAQSGSSQSTAEAELNHNSVKLPPLFRWGMLTERKENLVLCSVLLTFPIK